MKNAKKVLVVYPWSYFRIFTNLHISGPFFEFKFRQLKLSNDT